MPIRHWQRTAFDKLRLSGVWKLGYCVVLLWFTPHPLRLSLSKPTRNR